MLSESDFSLYRDLKDKILSGEENITTKLTINDKSFSMLELADKDEVEDNRLVDYLLINGITDDTGITKSRTKLLVAINRDDLALVKQIVTSSSNIFQECLDIISPLHLAVMNNNYAIVEYLIHNRCNVNAVHINKSLLDAVEDGYFPTIESMAEIKDIVSSHVDIDSTALHIAIEASNYELINLLLDYGADINPPVDMPPLSWAIVKSDCKMIKFLISRGAEINPINKAYLPLSTAVRMKNEDIVKVLLENKACVNAITRKGETALSIAVKQNDSELTALLLNAGAFNQTFNQDKCLYSDIAHSKTFDYLFNLEMFIKMLYENYFDDWDSTIKKKKSKLIKVTYEYHSEKKRDVCEIVIRKYNLKFCRLIVDVCVNIKRTPNVVNWLLHTAVSHNDCELVEYLANHGANLNCQWQYTTPLNCAVENSSPDLVDSLIQHKADPNYCTEYDSTPLVTAVNENEYESFEILLILAGADVNSGNSDDKRLIHYAAEENNYKVIENLIEYGADVNVSSDYSPLICAIQRGRQNPEVIKLLLKHNAYVNFTAKDDSTPLGKAIKVGNSELVKILIEAGANIHAECYKMSPLQFALDGGRYEIANFLINNGASFSTLCFDQISLCKAISSKSVELVKLIIDDKIADVNAITDHKMPLHLSIRLRNYNITKYLLNQGANANFCYQDNTPLQLAVIVKCIKTVKLLIKHNAKVDEPSTKGLTALGIAIETKNFPIAKLLVEAGADINFKNEFDENLLLHAVKGGNRKIVELLLDNGAEVNKNPEEAEVETALGIAVTNNNYEITELLTTFNADLNDFSDKHNPLTLSITNNNYKICKYLIHHGAGTNGSDITGQSPLFVAVRNNNRKIVKLLLENGADVNFSENGYTALNIAVWLNNLKMVKILVKAKADVNSALKLAIARSNMEIAQFLIRSGADVNILSEQVEDPIIPQLIDEENIAFLGLDKWEWLSEMKKKRSLLELAIKKRDFKMVKMLINAEANIELISDLDKPLHLAIKERNYEIVEYLISIGCDINAISNDQTPLYIAIIDDNLEIVRLLLKHKVDVGFTLEKCNNVFCAAIKTMNIEIINILVDEGASVNQVTDLGNPLHLAVEQDSYEITEYLLNNGANVDAIWENETPLMVAIDNQNIKLIKLLQFYNADINLVTDRWTSLHRAVWVDNFELVKMFIDAGLLVNKIINSYDPLNIAIQNNNYKLVEFLISKGADINAVTERLGTPLITAAKRGCHEIIGLLIRNKADISHYVKKFGTVLDVAVRANCNLAVIEALVSAGANINKHFDFNRDNLKIAEYFINHGADPNLLSRTLLYRASFSGTKEFVSLLLNAGINVNFVDKRNKTVLTIVLGKIKIKKLIVQHVIKLMAADFYVSEINKQAVRSDDIYETFRAECDKEVDIMKNTKVLSTKFSYYNILHKKSHQLALLMKNFDDHCFEIEFDQSKLPLYSDIIKYRVKKAIERKNMLIKVDNYIRKMFPRIIPDTCIRYIFDHLNNRDLEILYQLK